MKNFIFALILATGITGAAFTQETEKKDIPNVEEEKFNTLFSGVKPKRIGGWGAPVLKVVNVAPGFNGPFGLMVGGEGGIIFDRSVYLGGAGYSFVTEMDRYHVINDLPTGNNIHLSYGGLIFRYHFFPKSVVSFSIGTILGGGSYGNSPPQSAKISGMNIASTSSAAFVAEPEIYMFINLAKFCRFGVGGSYRMLVDDGYTRNGLKAMDLWGYSINVMFQFGRL